MTRQPQPVKLWYLVPMFRYNRVQRGRFREHYQFGVEVDRLGGSGGGRRGDRPAAPVVRARRRARGLRLQLNSIGDAKCRPAYIELLVAFLDEHIDELCDECRERRDMNPLRVLDCKREGCRAVLAQAPKITDHLCEECAAHFADVRALPGRPRRRRTRSTTRWCAGSTTTPAPPGSGVAGELGAQAHDRGGGRYDGLAEQLGGPPTPGVGFGPASSGSSDARGDRRGARPRRSLDALFAVLTPTAARPAARADGRRQGGRGALRRGVRRPAPEAGRSSWPPKRGMPTGS